MRYQPLGTSGLIVSSVGVGCNAFGKRIDQKATGKVIDAAIDAGINFFDTADSYSSGVSEQMLGKALGGRRDEVVIATKFGMDTGGLYGEDFGVRGSRGYIARAVEGSLRRLGTDYIDLYQLHTPDRVTPLEETLDALSDLVTAGKVRYIGSSNMTAWEVVNADWLAESLGAPHFITAQNEYSLYNRSAEAELVPALETFGISLLPYFPLAYGLLTGKYKRDRAPAEGTRLATETFRYDGADFDIVEGLQKFADDRGIGLLDVAIGGLLAQPAVGSVISGTTRPDQIDANMLAAQWDPSAEDLAELDDIVTPGSGQGYTTYAS
ncbi:aldo/keto reductase [Gordonia pseudamarae]|uniref:aldo/keto reductase n=1 Tax=Gordonia TaxID=2053 RepID=UPI0019C9979C|nr:MULTISPECIES: aldo/keto reductase [Gordonia]MBD0022121.1 aldo/keto reductase [Gordonia sp. (in: high G+C Gram-positive bacteria)]QHN24970.1 aldo/keto reductase [Gordonia pseudamarae]